MEGGSAEYKHHCLANLQEGTGGKKKKKGDESRRGEIQKGFAKAAPMTSSATSLNPTAGVTGRCSAFSMIMTDLLSSIAASRSFEQLLNSKLSLGFLPAPVPARRTDKGLVAP